jgi:hypothetical protein
MKVLILGSNQGRRYNWGHQHFKDEIARQHDVQFYGEGHNGWRLSLAHIDDILEELRFYPDLIFSYMGKYCKWMKGLDDVGIPKAHFVVDYFPWNYSIEDTFIDETRPGLVFAPCQHEVRALLDHGHRGEWMPFSVSPSVFSDRGRERDLDVTAIFSVVRWAYPNRHKILDTLRKLPIQGVIQASWPKTRVWHQDYVDALQRSKIVMNGVDKHYSLNWKFLEPTACGAMLLTEWAEDMAEMRFQDGKNCVVFEGMVDMVEKIRYYLAHENERREIAEAGRDLVHERHTIGRRVEAMMRRIEGGLL